MKEKIPVSFLDQKLRSLIFIFPAKQAFFHINKIFCLINVHEGAEYFRYFSGYNILNLVPLMLTTHPFFKINEIEV